MCWRTVLSALVAGLTLVSAAVAQTPSLAPATPELEVAKPLAPAPASPQLTAQDAEAWLDGFMPYALQRGDIAGAVVVVVKDSQVLVEKGYGYSDVAKRQPVDPRRTLFRPGSVSKLFTWTAVMQLVEQGKLDLDADVNRYLDFKIPARDGKPITLRNIMTHTPGFEEQVKSLMSEGATDPLDVHLKRWIPKRIFAPGTTPAYSNYATALAGYIVQRRSGQDFNAYLDEHVFGPLGMTMSTFRQPLPDRLKPFMSKGYALGSGEAKPFEFVSLYPAGSLSAPGGDMAKFMIAHLQGGGPLLKPETAKLMHESAYTVIPGVNRMLLGFYEQNRNGRRIIGHGGDTQWFHSNMHLYLDEGVGLYVSMNSAGKDGASGPLRTALFEGFTDRYFPSKGLPKPAVDLKTAKAHAALMAGVYDNSRRADSTFLRLLDLFGSIKVADNEDGTISINLIRGLNDVSKKWREIRPFVWREIGGDSILAAEVRDGKVVRFTGDDFSPFMMFERSGTAQTTVWLLPALIAAAVALALTGLLWPVTALVRRKYGASFGLEGRSALAYRLVRVAALAAVIVFGAWVGLVVAMFADFSLLSPKMDPVLWLLQLAALVVLVGAAVVGLWNAFVVWTSGRSWFARLWSLVLAASFLVLLYAAFVYRLIGFGVNY